MFDLEDLGCEPFGELLHIYIHHYQCQNQNLIQNPLKFVSEVYENSVPPYTQQTNQSLRYTQ
uniref:Uncharacterized protein n=1 Tax=Cannabis sativa TaxID=3483 RepID=A0A803QUN3_CANSA